MKYLALLRSRYSKNGITIVAKKSKKKTSLSPLTSRHRHPGLPRRRRCRRGRHRHALRDRRHQLRCALQRQLLGAVAGEHVPDLVRDDEGERGLVVLESFDEARVDDDLPSRERAGVDLVVVDDDDLPKRDKKMGFFVPTEKGEREKLSEPLVFLACLSRDPDASKVLERTLQSPRKNSPREVLQVSGEAPLPVPTQRGPDDGRPEPRAPLRLRRRVGKPALGGQQLRERRLPEGPLDALRDHHRVLPARERHLLPEVFPDDAEEEDDAAGGEEREADVHGCFLCSPCSKERERAWWS